MSNIQTFSSKQDIHQQACEWISRLDRRLNEEEEQRFRGWVNISHAHRQCLFEVAQTWDELTVLNELSTLFPLQGSHRKQTKVFASRQTMGMAASLAFVFISCFTWIMNTQFVTSNSAHSLIALAEKTSIGEQREVSLADGSVIHLNTDSVVSVDFSDTRRDVHLIRGEAYFEVAHDEQRPFTVRVGDNSVTAVGTAFNVQITQTDNLELLVTEGKVLVKNKTQINPTTDMNDLSHPLDDVGELMVAGQKAVITHQSIRQLTLSSEQVQNDLAWQQGMLVFHGEPLTEVLQEISRYTSVHFTLTDNKVKQRRVAGYFKANDIEGLLFALENNFNIVYEKLDEQTITLSSGS